MTNQIGIDSKMVNDNGISVYQRFQDHDSRMSSHESLMGSLSTLPTWMQVNIADTLNQFYNSMTEINVKTPPYNLKGDGSDESTTLQTLFNLARDNGSVYLYFPQGTYGISTYMHIYDSTFVRLHAKATLLRLGTTSKMFANGDLANKSYVVNGGYTGNGNIHFTGGTIDLNHRSSVAAGMSTTSGTEFMDVGHAQNFSFVGMKFVDGRSGHYWQISSSRNVLFQDLDFQPSTYVDTSTKNHELIQIEVATKLSFPSFGNYDLTPSRDIFIERCNFDTHVRCVGTHSFVNTQSTTGSISANSYQLTVVDVTKFNAGEAIYVEDAGSGFGQYLSSTISSIAGNVLTLVDKASTTVTNTKVANATDMNIASVFNENIVIRDCMFKNISDQPIRLMAYRYVTVDNCIIQNPQSDAIYLSQVEDSEFIGNIIINTIKTGFYISASSRRNKFTKNVLKEISTGGGYTGFRMYTSFDNTFEDNTVTSVVPQFNYAFYASDGCTGNKITSHKFDKGISGRIGASDSTEWSNLMTGNGQDVLFNGDLTLVNDTGTLAHDIRNYSQLIIVGNQNSSTTASLVTLTIPKSIYYISSLVGRFKFIFDDTAGTNRAEFSFPTGTSIRLDTISGTCHIRQVIGVI